MIIMNPEIEAFEINLSKDLETEGFDLQAGQTWIYPTNYPIRDYQYNIVQQALLKNTLVSLPTGLGKTFIAAVVMYNFFRWYPLGKIIFMAPTRPLVRQQIEACYDIMGIPKDVTVEITGTKLSASRGNIWKEKRVFFITPQILQNDLEKIIELRQKIKCLVFDEAHKARRNHSYCEVIRKLLPHNKYFRVLALSATPGSSISDVSEVVQNLLISHLEFRTEESIDVKPYVFERNLTTVVVPLGEKLQQVRDNYMQVLECYTSTLIKYKVLQGNCGNLTKGKIFMTLKEFQQKTHNTSSSNYGEIMKSLNICITLYHGFELLVRHGLRSFLSFFEEHKDKPLLRGSFDLMEILNDIREYLGPEPVIEQLPDGSFVEIPNNSKFGHPKFYKLRDILISHFSQENNSSRVIVFFEYRNSVMEAYALLNQSRPLLKPRIFLGQGGGITQRQQLKVVESFKEGQCNILLSTCIGEEGLDVGDIDLIVCFDISNKSPIRMVQRMGRTGRKKAGHVTVLVTEGKEQQILKDCLVYKNNITLHVLSSKELAKGLNTNSPRLVPPDIVPKCGKMYITVKKPVLTKKSSLKDMFRNISNRSEPCFSPDLQIVEIEERIPTSQSLWDKGNPLDANLPISNIFSRKIERQRALQSVHLIKHSSNSELLVNLLQHVDSKRFNIPTTQMGYPSQLTHNRNLKQGDIRNMFLKSQSSNDSLPGTQAQKLSGIETISQEDNSAKNTKELLTEVSNYLSIQALDDKTKCKHCPDNFNCNCHNFTADSNAITTLIHQDESVFNTITLENLNLFFELHVLKLNRDIERNVDSGLNSSVPHDQNKYKSSTPPSEEVEPIGGRSEAEKTFTYQAPKTLDSLLNRYSTSILEKDYFLRKQEQSKKTSKNKICSSYSVGCNSEPSDTCETFQNLLEFFSLKCLEELFRNRSDSQETIVSYSPDIIENSFMQETDASESSDQRNQYNLSPVLWTSDRVRNIRDFHKNPSDTSEESLTDFFKSVSVRPVGTGKRTKINFKNLKRRNSSKTCEGIDSPSKFAISTVKSCSTPLFSKVQRINATKSVLQREGVVGEEIRESQKLQSNRYGKRAVEKTTPLFSKVQKINTTKSVLQVQNDKRAVEKTREIDIDDLCDLSIFGLETTENLSVLKSQSNSNNVASTNLTEKDLCIDEICDLSMFGLENQPNKQAPSKVAAQENSTKENSEERRTGIDIKSNVLENKTLSSIDLQNYNRTVPASTSAPTQVTITQMIDFLNTSDKGSLSQKENIVEPHIAVNKDNSKLQLSPKKKGNSEQPTGSSKFLNSVKRSDSFDDIFQTTFCDNSFRQKTNRTNKGSKGCDSMRSKPTWMKKKKTGNPFVENEAEVSSDENCIVSEDEDDHDQNFYDESFVDDCTQNVDTQMHVKYLQSIRSPRNQGTFKIPQRPKFNITNVYSQEVHREDDTYLDDSFIVHDEIEDVQHEKSELEILEEKLRRVKKKKRHKSDDTDMPAKRKRIMQLSSDESD